MGQFAVDSFKNNNTYNVQIIIFLLEDKQIINRYMNEINIIIDNLNHTHHDFQARAAKVKFPH